MMRGFTRGVYCGKLPRMGKGRDLDLVKEDRKVSLCEAWQWHIMSKSSCVWKSRVRHVMSRGMD